MTNLSDRGTISAIVAPGATTALVPVTASISNRPETGARICVRASSACSTVMREVEAWWLDADFPDDKLSVIERLKAVAQGMA